jgi:hypothetical protein
MRLKGLNLDQLERVAEFLERAYSCGWTIDQLIDIITRLKNSGLLDLDQQSLGLLHDFLECAKSRNLKPEHIIEISQRTEDEWRRLIQKGQEIGYQQGIDHHAAWFIELAGKTHKDLGLLASLGSLVESAKQMAMGDLRS